MVGNVVDVRVSTQNGISGSANDVSRVPGFGQPCNLPLSEFDPSANLASSTALLDCGVQDVTLLK
jgi:hypothetical protein